MHQNLNLFSFVHLSQHYNFVSENKKVIFDNKSKAWSASKSVRQMIFDALYLMLNVLQ